MSPSPTDRVCPVVASTRRSAGTPAPSPTAATVCPSGDQAISAQVSQGSVRVAPVRTSVTRMAPWASTATSEPSGDHVGDEPSVKVGE